MAIRLSKAFGGSPRLWLALQMDYDLAQALKRAHRTKVRIKVRRLHPAA
jgi:plasmid maintenance system antidote protein VapI